MCSFFFKCRKDIQRELSCDEKIGAVKSIDQALAGHRHREP